MADDDDHQIGYQALPRGVPVHTADGVLIGTVYRVLDNAREHIFDGIVVDTGDGRRFVDAPEVARITRSQRDAHDRRRGGRRPARPRGQARLAPDRRRAHGAPLVAAARLSPWRRTWGS